MNSKPLTRRTVRFQFDERSLVPIETLKAQGYWPIFEEPYCDHPCQEFFEIGICPCTTRRSTGICTFCEAPLEECICDEEMQREKDEEGYG